MDKCQWHMFKKPVASASHFIWPRKEHGNSMSHFIPLSSSSPHLSQQNAHLSCRFSRNGRQSADESRLSSADCMLSRSPHWLWPHQDTTGWESRGQMTFVSSLSFRLRPYNKLTWRAIGDQRCASPSDNPPRPCQSRPLILNLVSTSVPARRPHLCSNPS